MQHGRAGYKMGLIRGIVNILIWSSFSLLGFLAPRDKKSIIVLAPANSAFADNAKYAYLWLDEEKDLSVKYITYDRSICDELIDYEIQAVYYPSWSAFLALLRASVVVGSDIVSFLRIKGHLTCGAKRIQLWHGAGLKNFQLGSEKYQAKNKTLRNRFDWFINRKIPLFDLIYFPSEKMKEFRKGWFRFKEVKINGFVRNDILLGKTFGKKQEIFTDHVTINTVKVYKARGSKMILYAPTFRNIREPLFEKQIFFDFDAVNKMMIDNDVLFVIKQHPVINEQLDLYNYERIEEYERAKDIYPAMDLFDILITDHSSIFSDYALLNRPIIHYIPDYDRVVSEHCVSSVMAEKLPGPVFIKFDEFREYLELLLKGLVIFKPLEENVFHDYSNRLSGLQLVEDVRRLAKI
jgi:CDP-glycerol glycerophosphotransferase